MASKPTNPATNGAGRRKLQSWIDQFVLYTANLESAPLYRKWTAISALGAILEQKIWITTSSPLYPNLYVLLVGHAGIGKTRAIWASVPILRELPEFHLAPTSMTMASMVDALVEAKRVIVNLPDPPLDYNSMYIAADELSAFMHEYNNELIAGLTAFYNVTPYGQRRRGGDLKIKIDNPQLNIIAGVTPASLLNIIPAGAWEQGFTSRVIMIFANEKPQINVWEAPKTPWPIDLIHDIKVINGLFGEMGWTKEWAEAMHNWKELGFPKVPQHPRLRWYNERRHEHMMKLSMIACIDAGNHLMLTKEHFNRAMGWLLEAELFMPEIFRDGQSTGTDSKIMDEVIHLMGDKEVPESQLVRYLRDRVPSYAVIRVLEVMERSAMIRVTAIDGKTGLRKFSSVGPTAFQTVAGLARLPQ